MMNNLRLTDLLMLRTQLPQANQPLAKAQG